MHNTHLKLTDLQSHGCMVYQAETHPIAIFAHDDNVFAVDNRCPHMGFPLAQGSVKDGILTCHWHHARFDLASGGAFDLFADDVRAFPTEVRDSEIWLDLTPLSPDAQRAHQRRRLQHGLERDLNLVIAKSVIALMKELSSPSQGEGLGVRVDVAREPFAVGLDFGARNRQQGWAMGQTIHVAMMNLVPFLDTEDSARALYHGLSAVARDCDGAPARHAIEPLPMPNLAKGLKPSQGFRQLKQWFRRFVEVRDEEGAERCIVTATQLGATPAQMTDLLMSAATDHRYIQIGHTVDFANKAIEAWQIVGADLRVRPDAGTHTGAPLPVRPDAGTHTGAPLLASLAPSFAEASRAEESNAWRNPIDLVEILENAFEQLLVVLAEGARQHDSLSIQPTDQLTNLTNTLLSDNPHDIAAAMLDALRHGMTMEQLAGIVCYTAALRMARFHTSNEFGDWDTVLHTFTFANAIHQAMRRAPSIELLRGVFDAAMSIYLDRFLNLPAAKIPQPEKTTAKPDDLLEEFLSLLNRQQQVNEVALLCVQYLANAGEPARLMATMGKALLREDPDFHTIQTVEAAFAQYGLWRGAPQANHFLIAATRYLAAHSPTTRAMEQTFRIAWRLHRGDRLFAEE